MHVLALPRPETLYRDSMMFKRQEHHVPGRTKCFLRVDGNTVL